MSTGVLTETLNPAFEVVYVANVTSEVLFIWDTNLDKSLARLLIAAYTESTLVSTPLKSVNIVLWLLTSADKPDISVVWR